MLYQLKLAILQAGMHQYEVATKLGISETRLSRILTGRLQPSDLERRKMVQLLGVSESLLFSTRSSKA